MSDSVHHPHWLLRRADQAAIAVLATVALLATIGWWVAHGGWQERLIEIDAMEPLTARFEIDINAADWPELMLLPGVGETLAHRILESRRTRGPFLNNDDLRRVRGIGPKTFEHIRPYLRPMPGEKPPGGGSNK
jgi:competence protein ComEA